MHMTKADFYRARPREGVLDGLRKEAPKYRGQSVFMSLSCDPYQPIEAELGLTRKAIEIFHSNEVGVTLLTKNGKLAQRDFDLLASRPDLSRFGVTLTFDNEADSRAWEPGASLPKERIKSLKKAHELGIETWASIEPVIIPEQTLRLIQKTHEFVDSYEIGKWNHDQRAKEIDWHAFGHAAIALCERLGKEHLLFDDLVAYL